MKKLNKTKLGLKSETIRALASTTLEKAAGGITGLRCESAVTQCGAHCNTSWGWICIRSQQVIGC